MPEMSVPDHRRLPACRTGDSERVLDIVWALIGGSVERASRRITYDREFRADLVQEARIVLWKIDATRFDLRQASEQRYLRRLATNRMWNAWRDEMARRGEASL